MDTTTPSFTCPICQHVQEPPPPDDPTQPPLQPGDIHVCLKCATILFFDDQLTPAKITPEQIADHILNDGNWTKIKKKQQAVRFYQQGHKM